MQIQTLIITDFTLVSARQCSEEAPAISFVAAFVIADLRSLFFLALRLHEQLAIVLMDSFIQSALAILGSEGHLCGQLALSRSVRSSVDECLGQSLSQWESRQAYLVANFALRWSGALENAAWLAHEGRATRHGDPARVPG